MWLCKLACQALVFRLIAICLKSSPGDRCLTSPQRSYSTGSVCLTSLPLPGVVTIPREGKNSLLPLLCLAVELFTQLPVSIRCAGKLAVLGTCWIPLSSCTKVHLSCSDGNIFHLLPTDSAIWTKNCKQVYLMGEKY